jgi:thioredoxin reductase
MRSRLGGSHRPRPPLQRFGDWCRHGEEFEGFGISDAATDLEARFCRGDEIVVVDDSNSAGQSAMLRSGSARRVHLSYLGSSARASWAEGRGTFRSSTTE